VVVSQLKEELSRAAEQLETMNNHYTLLEVDNHQCKQMLESSNAQITKLKSMLSTRSYDLESVNGAKENLQKQLESAHHQLDNATSSLSCKVL
jgi:chromosome segregation ATPase